jgi:hypothetical protein
MFTELWLYKLEQMLIKFSKKISKPYSYNVVVVTSKEHNTDHEDAFAGKTVHLKRAYIIQAPASCILHVIVVVVT